MLRFCDLPRAGSEKNTCAVSVNFEPRGTGDVARQSKLVIWGVDGFVTMCLLDASNVSSRLYALQNPPFAGIPAMHEDLGTARS